MGAAPAASNVVRIGHCAAGCAIRGIVRVGCRGAFGSRGERLGGVCSPHPPALSPNSEGGSRGQRDGGEVKFVTNAELPTVGAGLRPALEVWLI